MTNFAKPELLGHRVAVFKARRKPDCFTSLFPNAGKTIELLRNVLTDLETPLWLPVRPPLDSAIWLQLQPHFLQSNLKINNLITPCRVSHVEHNLPPEGEEWLYREADRPQEEAAPVCRGKVQIVSERVSSCFKFSIKCLFANRTGTWNQRWLFMTQMGTMEHGEGG